MTNILHNARICLLGLLVFIIALGLVAFSDPTTQGTLELLCDIRDTTATDSLACRVTLDGVVQTEDTRPGITATYALDPGSHTLLVELVGGHATYWVPASQQQIVNISTGQTSRVTPIFVKKGYLHARLSATGIGGDFYLDGELVAAQVAGIDLWVMPKISHRVEVKNIADPASAGAYTWRDAYAYILLSSGQEKTVILKPKQAWTVSVLNLICEVSNAQAGGDVVCSIIIDGQRAGDMAPGGQVQYRLPPGRHTITGVLSGGDAHRWRLIQSKSISTRLGRTTNLTLTFDLLPYQYTVALTRIDANTLAIYKKGQQLGNKRNVFVKVGDCDSANYFLYGIDDGLYSLGNYNHLLEAIYFFAGSFNHKGVAAHDGYVAASVLNPLWADPKLCHPGETPLACEYRIQRPSVALIMLRTHHYGDDWLNKYHQDLQTIVEYSLEKGVIPVLSTLPRIEAAHEGLYEMNGVIRDLAIRYDVPLWDLFITTEQLPNRGTDANAHLTIPLDGLPTFFVDNNLSYGMTRRNLEALEVLHRLRKEVIK